MSPESFEARINSLLEELGPEVAAGGPEARWALVRALIHRAVHFSTEAPGVEFCHLATYLAGMIGHAHTLAHGDTPSAHGDKLH
jgi:hypothetical protein